MIKNKKGFTLSEVLLTVGVVGVLAAILTPAIVHVSPSSNKVLFKKAYTMFESAIQEMSNDQLHYPPDQTGKTNLTTSPIVSRGFNYTSVISSGDGAMNMPSDSTVNKFCYLLADKLDAVEVINDKTCPISPGKGQFTTSEGITWTIIPGTFPMNPPDFSTKVIMDVNGGILPNCTADLGYNSISTYTLTQCSGCPTTSADVTAAVNLNKVSGCNPDIFIFGVRYDGKIQIGSGYNGDSSDPVSMLSLMKPLDTLKN